MTKSAKIDQAQIKSKPQGRNGQPEHNQRKILIKKLDRVEHQIRKVYTLATERVEEVSDQQHMYKDYLRDDLEDWYTT